jgi:hypothetical protein
MKGPVFFLFAASLAAAGPALAGDGPRLTYSKSFPGSMPAYVQITVDKAGQVEYREALEDDAPLKFKMTETETNEVFGLSEKLGYFKTPVESGLKVAFMGKKIFRYENGTEKHEVEFNYSEDVSAKALWEWFERMTESAQLRVELERTAKYDKLGVVKALTLLGSSLERKRLVGPEQYLPTLDRIIKNESYMHTARVRASEIAEAIRSGAAAAQ